MRSKIDSMALKSKSTHYVFRGGKSRKADAAFFAWSSGNLDAMLAAMHTKTNKVDRHFLLQSIVSACYGERTNEKRRAICREVAELHISEFGRIAPALKKEFSGSLPRVSTFENYAKLLAEEGEYDKAIHVCEKALSFGLDDNTVGGYDGRIVRLKKQKSKHLEK